MEVLGNVKKNVSAHSGGAAVSPLFLWVLARFPGISLALTCLLSKARSRQGAAKEQPKSWLERFLSFIFPFQVFLLFIIS
jgi:hypothetical protein